MTTRYLKILEYLMIAAGAGVAFLSAFEPQPAGVFYLHAGILLVGLLPYFIYSFAVALMDRALVTVHGVVLLAIHIWMVSAVRFATTEAYGVSMLVYGPVVLSLLLIPLVILALRRPWGVEASE
ncbi:hypothetical protein [Thiohalophilus thiocyanatoxydans]|uniref:Uncharacterized protein n=1 Tax=Thiohalophilus thiocyanatoxydans TaxID=381308 RepID=A0A4R8IK66_9GAMM|nr:hypothetical protein [Thiohalophilus thiocyanatoxydans]TDY01126.1 hypothetical protein EDC23_1872 [Thiohalophilus thiocyanatoxydans]